MAELDDLCPICHGDALVRVAHTGSTLDVRCPLCLLDPPWLL